MPNMNLVEVSTESRAPEPRAANLLRNERRWRTA